MYLTGFISTEYIKNGKFKYNGEYINIESTEVKSAECILGNAYATKYSLKQGDFLGDILNKDTNFFKNKLESAYLSNNINSDLVLMSLSSSKIHVNIVDKLDSNFVNTFKTIVKDDGEQYVVDQDGKIISPFNKDLMQVKQDGDNIIIDIKLENLILLDNPSIFGYVKINNNSKEILNVLKNTKIISENFKKEEYLSKEGNFDITKYNSSFNDFITRQSIKLTTSFINIK